MKFLPNNMNNKDLMLLNVIYTENRFEKEKPDILDLIIKDKETNQKFVFTIENPKIVINVTKPKYRDKWDHIRDYVDKDLTDEYSVHYRSRFQEAAKILKCSVDDAKKSPHLFNIDIKIEHFYILQFQLNYTKNNNNPLDLGYLDIEVDTIAANGFPESGHHPVNMVSYFHETTMSMYTLFLTTDNVPPVLESNPKYLEYKEMKESFHRQVDDFIANLDRLNDDMNNLFEEIYGKINYYAIPFDSEIDMIIAIFKLLENGNNDFLQIFNAPFDAIYLYNRIRMLGFNPNTIISNQTYFPNRQIEMKEDKNPFVHKRKHLFQTFTTYTITDQMVNYGGIRAGRGKIPSFKLNAIAKKELGDEKLDYGEYGGNIATFPYINFYQFYIYNVKDVLLQYGLNKKSNDMAYIYNIMFSNAVNINEVFTSTATVYNSYRKYGIKNLNLVMGINRNKIYDSKTVDEIIEDYEEPFIGDDEYEDEEESYYEDDEEFELEEDVEDDVPEKSKKVDGKKDKFAGAFVMNTKHMSPSGYILLGKPAKYIHNNVIDMDITSEYPTANEITNNSNETMVAKVILLRPEEIKIPLYQNMYFLGKADADSYKKIEPSNWMMEILSQDDPLNFGNLFLNLPNMDEIFDEFEAIL